MLVPDIAAVSYTHLTSKFEDADLRATFDRGEEFDQYGDALRRESDSWSNGLKRCV